MNENTVILMLSVSIFLGAMSLVAFIWGLRNNQFDDEKRSYNAVLFDSEDDLNDAARAEAKKKSYEKKRGRKKED